MIALLPIKANSERIVGKNFKNFNGKPLFYWVLNSLIGIKEISKIIINTDAEKNLFEDKIIESSKIILRKRKSEICGDFVSINEILKDDILSCKENSFLMTHTTNPLVSKDTFINVINKFKSRDKTKYDSLFTVNKIQTRFYDKNTKAINHNISILERTQDLEPWYEENSNIYLFTKESFFKNDNRIGDLPIMFETPPLESFDIDNEEDWDIASLIHKYKNCD